MVGILLMVVVMLAQAVPNAGEFPNCTGKWISPPYDSYSCYLFSSKEATFKKADRRCKRFNQFTISGADVYSLVRIETALEDDWLTEHTENRTGNNWIWVMRFPFDSNDWHWLDCLSEFVIKAGLPTLHYSNFISGEPNNHKKHGEYCGSKVRRVDGKWNDFPCSNTQKFICERRPSVVANALAEGVPYNPRPPLDIVDVCYQGLNPDCVFGEDYAIIDGSLEVYTVDCLGMYQCFYH